MSSASRVEPSEAEQFRIEIPQKKLDWIRERVRDYPWHEMPSGAHWEYGTPLPFMKDLADYWVHKYEWKLVEAKINQFAHYKAKVGDETLHFIHEPGSGDNPQPLLILHGWPYSFVSLLDVIQPLAHPEQFGGDAQDGFDVVVASLPGFGFSSKPKRPMGPQKMGELLNQLMTKILGYDQYLVQGGDWGGYIASRMGFEFPKHVAGIHSNSFMVRHAGALEGSGQVGTDNPTPEESQFVQSEQQSFLMEGGYAIIQGTRPQSLSYAMMDSPIGVAAWLIEKFHGWSDQKGKTFEKVFSMDQLITEVMIYLVTDTFNTASWIYNAYQQEGSGTLPEGKRVEVPVAFAAFPDPAFAPPPRSFMERSHNVVQWSEPPHGGHFPFLEVPDLYLEDVRRFARMLRNA